jgi:hypothetical protein
MDDPSRCAPPQSSEPCDERLDDLTVYRRLLTFSGDAERLSRRCWSAGATSALEASAIMLRKIASALYKGNLDR